MSARRFVVIVAAVAGIGSWVALTPTTASAAPTDLYVATAGSDSNSCTTSVEPCHTIGQAISLAGTSGTTIHVAAGQYGTVTPGSKNVTVVGVGTAHDTGTYIVDLGAGVVVNDPAGVLTLKSVAVAGEVAGAYVTAGTLNASGVSFDQSPCGVFMSAGQVNLTDSRVYTSGITGASDCYPLTSTPAAVTVNGGDLSMVRSGLVDTKGEPGIVVNGGTFTATGSQFSDATYAATNNNATVHIGGGSALIQGSTFTAAVLALQTTGGSTSIYDSTFYTNEYGIIAASNGSYPSVFRSTFYDSPINGPVTLAGDVLTSHFGAACSQEPIDQGYNYGTGGGCTFNAPTSHGGVATLNLDTSAGNHGGPTLTVTPRMPSALVDVIPTGATWGPQHKPLCPADATDQRGVVRRQGAGCDVGAVELTASRVSVSAAIGAGTSVMLTAAVSADAGGFQDPDPATGAVTFKMGGTTLCAAVPVTAGAASCATTQLPPGSSTVTADFVSSSAYLSGTGSGQVFMATKPQFKGKDHAKATIGHHASIKIQASGAPEPSVKLVKGKLPKGMKFSDHHGHAKITGTPAPGSAGKYVLHLRVQNSAGSETEKFTLKIS